MTTRAIATGLTARAARTAITTAIAFTDSPTLTATLALARCTRTPRLRLARPRRPFLGLLARLRQQSIQLRLINTLEGTEIGARQRGGLERFQQFEAGTAFLLLQGRTLLILGTAARQLLTRHFLVLFGQIARWLPIQIKAMRAANDGIQIGRGAGVATQDR